MTIEEALEVLKGYLDKLINMPYALDCDIKAFDIAIRCMEALPKVREEIAERKRNSGGEPNRDLAFNVCLQIIDRHLKEVEE